MPLKTSLNEKHNLIFKEMETPYNIISFRKAVVKGDIMWRKHAAEKMIQRDILRQDVIDVLINGACIQTYHTDKPFPSALFLGFIEGRPIHVIAAFDDIENLVYIITAYSPNLMVFEDDFKTKRK